MAQDFFQAFDKLKVSESLEKMYRDTKVTKIKVSKKMDMLDISVCSSHLLSHKDKENMEYQIKKQLFEQLNVVMDLEFNLSSQYTPKLLWEEYEESVIEELKGQNPVYAKMYRDADKEWEGDNLLITWVDNIFSRQYDKAVVDYLLDILNRRCHFNTEIRTSLKKAEETGERKEETVFYKHPQKLKEEEKEEKKEEEKEKKKEKEKQGESASHKDKGGNSAKKKSDKQSADIIYGRDFKNESTAISEIQDEIGDVVIHGKIVKAEGRELRSGKFIYTMDVTDFTDSISVKLFLKPEEMPEIEEKLGTGRFISLSGIARMDDFSKELVIGSVRGIRSISDFTAKRMDDSEEKRVELHLHTTMSEMDGMIDPETMIKRIKSWGHKAVAITDHGVVQAFADAAHALDKGDDLKIIYGMEGYLVDDVKNVAENEKGQDFSASYVVFDIETTGFSPVKDSIIEIGAVKLCEGEIVEHFSSFINPCIPIPYRIQDLTGINDEMVADALPVEEVLPKFLDFIGESVLVAHNAHFDSGFIREKAKAMGIDTDFTVVDTVALARIMLPGLKNHKLDVVAKELNVSLENHHRAVDDALACAGIFKELTNRLKEQGINTLKEMNENGQLSDDVIKKLPTYHIILLAKNDIGRVNLYRMVSLSHLRYYSRRPRIPRSILGRYREGIIIGSACEAGEFYQAVLNEKPMQEISRIVDFYDYLEIQPIDNNSFMLRSDKYGVETREELQEINKKIVSIGEQFHKPVVATCDVHFLDPEDDIYRAVIMNVKKFKDADMQAPLFLRTTQEMLDEFSYLGREKAREVVIKNSNMIADMVERISPVRPDKCPPVIEDSDKTLKEICYNKAHSMYGSELPEQVEKRLEKELNSIISNGFAVMYIIAQKLVWKSNEDGYLVGSRGSVGSSFVATMSGITEVNPLSPHYYCPDCHFTDFDSDIIKQHAGKSGFDLPKRNCPKCGKPLFRDGQDIPFETFLGFYGDKEPDIDLNFSGEYQSKAHAYTEVIFGKGQTFRAGTTGTVADKTAEGYVRKYDEEHGMSHRTAEISRLAAGCVGVKRTTGQHPGGIIVLPLGEEIDTFTPVQHPANDMKTPIITTHFDYHKIDHNLLKLDILGHDDPTMIRRLEDLTGVKAEEIPMDDENVLSLFQSLKALNIKPEDLDGCDIGTLGIPECGTEFVMGMLRETKPECFSDLVRISGLSHGTDVWQNNAQYFIENGDCTLSTAICTRDDIMTFLIREGVEKGQAFKIMESVRKGKGLKPEMEEIMKEAGIPEWYMESCRRIKYMFPKAHAVAYITMALRIGYFKVYYPLEYYAAYFGIRAKAFNYETMAQGREKLLSNIKTLKSMPKLSSREKEALGDMKNVLEMYARGFEFMPIDIYRAKANDFQVIDGKIMPALSVIDGMGDIAALAAVEAAKAGKFMSREDFKEKSKVSQTVIDKMVELHILNDLPASNQMTLFDLM